MQLDMADMVQITGQLPVVLPTWVDQSKIARVLEYLSQHPPDPLSLMTGQLAPDFHDKIRFNHLCPGFATLLESGSYQQGELDSYFASNAGLAQEIGADLHGIYEASKRDIPDDLEGAPDLRFLYIMERTIPPEGAVLYAPAEIVTAWRSAAIIVMAKYFEACDIYERPI